ncbi:MAG TPA: VWA domain-containing protein, partial [Myxococcales bacterium]|nr:VWA domain-containing protein [Myxococcales bacterium]
MLRRLLPALIVVLWGCSSDDGSSGSDGGFTLGKSAQVLVTPNPISFSSTDVGSVSEIEIRIENTSQPGAANSAELRLELPYLKKKSEDFTLELPKEMVIQPGDFTTMKVIYHPSDAVYDNDFLVIDYLKSDKAIEVPIFTLSQTGILKVNPDPIYFGAVNGGATQVIDVAISNLGSKVVDVGVTGLSAAASPDYSIDAVYASTDGTCNGAESSAAVQAPHTLAPSGGTYCVALSYSPFGGGSDLGKLVVYPPYDPEAPNIVPHAEVIIQGQEVGPEIDFYPESILNFEAVAIGEEKVMSFIVKNDGSTPLILDGIKKANEQSPAWAAIEIITQIAPGTSLEAIGNDNLEVQVRFKPTQSYPITYGPLGYIQVDSNDGDEAQAYVTVFGQVASPKLKLTPPDIVDFGIVGPGTVSERKFTLTNVGTVDLNVEYIQIGDNLTGEFSIKDPAGLANGGTIKAGDFAPLTLLFTHGGGNPGPVLGSIDFKTSDPMAPTQVTLKATRSDTLKCVIDLQPVKLNYGTVPYGFEKTLTMNVVNVGSAPCSWKKATINDGLEVNLFGGGGCSPGNSTKSSKFEIMNSMPGFKDYLKPGMSFPLEIKYAPEANFWDSAFGDAEFFSFGGLVQVTMYDFYQDPNGKEIVAPESTTGPLGEAYNCNVVGKSGVANIAAIPGDIDFGLTTLGCFSKTHTVTIYNTGKAPLSLCNVKLKGCGPEFKLKNVPAIPPCADNQGGLQLVQGQPITVDVVYAPQDLGKDGCTLVVESTDIDTPAVIIPLKGSGTLDDEQTDIFVQGTGQEVDVLFVVDNSGSMSEEQNSLASNFGSFVSAAQMWSTNYQIGVVSTDMEEFNDMRGRLLGDPRYVGPAQVNQFKGNVKVGDNGSGTEQGLVAAQTALSMPLVANPDNPKVCTTNADCNKPLECVPAVDSNNSYCGGWNMGFLRKNAALEIVFVSDEED